MSEPADTLSGRRIGPWLVLRIHPLPSSVRWDCRCWVCGEERTIGRAQLQYKPPVCKTCKARKRAERAATKLAVEIEKRRRNNTHERYLRSLKIREAEKRMDALPSRAESSVVVPIRREIDLDEKGEVQRCRVCQHNAAFIRRRCQVCGAVDTMGGRRCG